jgi:predicted lipoprotein with Yx(FWY)xxD motif
MRRNQRWFALAGLLAGALAISACGSSSGSDPGAAAGGSGNYPTATQSSAPNPTPSASTMSTTHGGLLEVKNTKLGKVLANPHGMTVYYYTADKPGSGVSNCTGSCATAWPPVIAPVRGPAGVSLPGAIGYIVRANGQHQVTVNGYPIYRYAGDTAPGDVNGNGISGMWHVIKLTSGSSATPSSGSSSSGSSGSGGGW